MFRRVVIIFCIKTVKTIHIKAKTLAILRKLQIVYKSVNLGTSFISIDFVQQGAPLFNEVFYAICSLHKGLLYSKYHTVSMVSPASMSSGV